MAMLKVRQRVGKYRIERRLGQGGFADVYAAMDTIEGIRVALKVPHADVVDERVLKDFRNEVRVAARLEHPNILPLRFAGYMDDRFVIVYQLGETTLADRITKRLSLQSILDYGEQMLQAAAYAHRSKIIHCDIKPENFILFSENRLKLTDFGIAKVAQKTVRGAGTGTIGYMAPEQAMGKPSFRSDVFSLGLILCRMLTGNWPEWPYDWPPVGVQRMRSRVHDDMLAVIRCATDLDTRRRFLDADHMLHDFLDARRKTERLIATRQKKAMRRAA
jgi:serine/threonine-protein kinase